nr:hypothetical protein [SAR324 cluster bacterium]
CFCSYAEATEIDHFLPKSKFSEFSIAPINLVPVCNRCNNEKKAYSSQRDEEFFIHPYYETCTEDLLWLEASVEFKSNYPIVSYFIRDAISSPLKERLKFQFDKLKLGERYRLQTGREFSGRKYRWTKAKDDGGEVAVKADLQEEYDSEKDNNKNSWKSALYEALLLSEQFCEMKWKI